MARGGLIVWFEELTLSINSKNRAMMSKVREEIKKMDTP